MDILLDFFKKPEKKIRFRYEGGVSYHDILYLIHKQKGRIVRRRGDPSKPLEKIWKVWQNRNRDQIKEFLDRLNAYPKTPTFQPDAPIELTEFIIHTLEHLMLFYLFYLTIACAVGKYDVYPMSAPLVEHDDTDDYWDTESYNDTNKRDFDYDSIILLYFGVFICGIISCYCLHYYYTRPDWNSLRAVAWSAYDMSFIDKSPFGYEYKRPILGKITPRLEIFYKVWFPYYYGHTYSDHCYGSTYYAFHVKRRYIPGFKRSRYWKQRVDFYMDVIISDIKTLYRVKKAPLRPRQTRRNRYYYLKALHDKIRKRVDICQNVRDWFAAAFPDMYVNSKDPEYRKVNGYVKNQKSRRFKQWRRKRRMF